MSMFLTAIFLIFLVFLLACGLCGYHRKIIGLCSLVVSSWTINFTWMSLTQGIDPLSNNALSAQLALTLFGLCGFATGWMISRMVHKFRETAVED